MFRVHRVIAGLVAVVLALAVPALLQQRAAVGQSPVPFTDAELRAIAALGPWPPPWTPDPSNRVSGNANAVKLGRLLFFDARLSGQGTHACSSCHRPETGWTDGRTVGLGLAPSRRNTPSLLDVRYRRWFGWDGAADSLWAQSIRPILDPREMGASAGHVRAHIAGNPALADVYAALFGRTAADTPAEDVLVDAAKALAAFQETLISPRTPFDDFWDALTRADAAAAGRYPDAARRGLKLFIAKGNCAVCHAGPHLTSGAFADNFIPRAAEPAQLDTGRYGGVERLLRSPYTLNGRFNDDAGRATAWDAKATAPADGDRGIFRVPALRGLTASAPYMHDGSMATLRDVVQHYARASVSLVIAAGPGKASRLTPAEIDDLVAFLESLGL
jgi:cytochrome c peroxidase